MAAKKALGNVAVKLAKTRVFVTVALAATIVHRDQEDGVGSFLEHLKEGLITRWGPVTVTVLEASGERVV